MYNLKDPTRIPVITALVQDVWEALPGMDFADILRMLDSAGCQSVGDEEVVEKLRALAARYPRTLGEGVRLAEIGRLNVTVDGDRVAVWGGELTPVTWQYDRLVSAQVGYPLHVVDDSGEYRRFGVIESITPVEAEQLAQSSIPELRRETIGDTTYLVETDAGDKCVIGRKVQLFEIGRRAAQQTTIAWARMNRTEIGGDLSIELRSGAGVVLVTGISAVYRLR